MSKDLVSIIVPVYKVEKYLDKCVQSIVNQTYTNLEIVLVDDGSPDKCPQMCNDWTKKDSRIKVIHKENGGLSSARNAGLDICKGEYIGFIDSDDRIDKNMYRLLIEFAIENELDMVNCNLQEITESEFFSDESFNIDARENKIYKSIDIHDDIILYNQGFGLNPYACTKLFKKSKLKTLRFDTNIKVGEDLPFCARHLKEIDKIGLLESKVYFYTKNYQSLSAKFNKNRIDMAKGAVEVLEMGLNFSEKSKKYLISRIVLESAYYILGSIKGKVEDNKENITYAQGIIKKYYKTVRSHEKMTIKNKVYIFVSLHFKIFYKPLKLVEKLLKKKLRDIS